MRKTSFNEAVTFANLQEVCRKCSYIPKQDSDRKMTVDHVVPQWLTKRVRLFEIDMPSGPKEILCLPCNVSKGGRVVYEDERVRNYLKEFIKKLEEKIKEHE